MKKISVALIALVIAVSLGLFLFNSPVDAGGRPLSAELLGSNEVNGGDSDGSGTAHITLNQGQGEVCFEITVEDIDTPTRAHIHRGVAGANGSVVVFFFDTVIPDPIPVPDNLTGCVDNVDSDLIKDIRQNPSNYYVNVHNAAFPGGAVRGQLEK